MEDKVLKLLNEDKIRNINFINFNNSYSMSDFYIVGKSVLGKGKSDRDWIYISSNSVSEFKGLIAYLKEEDKCFSVLEEWMIPYIVDRKDILWQLSCVRLFCPNEVILPENKEEIKNLKLEDAAYIFNNYNYQEFTSIEYIRERINNGIGLGIHEDNKLVAWIITHDDGAIGFLNVIKEYRRKGYGRELTVAMIKKLRKLDEVPFVHIEKDNKKSMNLALQIGFVEDRVVNWLERR